MVLITGVVSTRPSPDSVGIRSMSAIGWTRASRTSIVACLLRVGRGSEVDPQSSWVIMARRSPLAQTRDESGEVAGLGADVQCAPQDVLPG